MSTHLKASHSAPKQLFAQTAEQRTALARQLFFTEHTRPTGLVGEAVIHSWTRCSAALGSPCSTLAFAPVTVSRLHSALRHNHLLLESSEHEINNMEAALARTGCRVLLTDSQGVVVHATRNPFSVGQPLLDSVSRVGVNISEAQVGTTAPGIVTKTGVACRVSGSEHFFEGLASFQCAAAPIRDVQGALAAVLDVSTEARPFGFDAAALVGVYATMIENRLLQAQSREHLILCFQADPALLGTPMEALAGVTASGHVAWLNSVAMQLLGNPPDAQQREVDCVLNLRLPQLLQLLRAQRPQPARLPSGLGVWMTAVLTAPDGVNFNQAVAVSVEALPVRTAVPPLAQAIPATLGEHNRNFIATTLAASNGNVSKAARALGISRGTLYRKLQEA